MFHQVQPLSRLNFIYRVVHVVEDDILLTLK